MIELSILAHPSDLAFFEVTARHQLRHFAGCAAIDRRVVVLDLHACDAASQQQLVAAAEDLRSERLIDEVLVVDWDPSTVTRTMATWFNDAAMAASAARGKPRYQYLHTFEIAQRDLILHLDSDVLFSGATDWVDEAVQILGSSPEVVAVVPMAGAAIATTPLDWLLGRRRAVLPWPTGRNESSEVTTRHVLLSRRRLKALAPFSIEANEQLETSIGRAMTHAGARRVTMVDDRSRAWHPRDHNRQHGSHIGELASLVESGRYPYRRFGKAWDITTGGWRFFPWWMMGRRNRLRRAR